MSAKIYGGSCHCGAVSFTARVDSKTPTIRCNCSICTKSRTWIVPVAPADFALLTGADRLTPYRFGDETISHLFCARCGIKTHGEGKGEDGSPAWIAVSVSALDLVPAQLARWPITFADGRHDRPDAAPEVCSYL